MNLEQLSDRSGIETRQKLILGNQKTIIAWQQEYDQRMNNKFKAMKKLKIRDTIIGWSIFAVLVCILVAN